MNIFVQDLVEPLVSTAVTLGLTDTEEIPTLSLIVALKVNVCDCDAVVNVTVESFTVKDDIVGAWLSVFVTDIAILSVLVLPAASLAVNVTVWFVVPNE